MDVQSIVTIVSQKAGLDQTVAEKVVGTIFSVLEHEAEGTTVSSFFAKIPGADALARRHGPQVDPRQRRARGVHGL